MNHLFTKQSLMILESLSFTETLYAFDFDGTLSKIVPVPDDACMTETTTGLLVELSKIVQVAVISGRSLQNLKKRMNFTPHYVVGNHGLEGLGYSAENLRKAEQVSAQWKKTLAKAGFSPGVEIEDKTYSLAVHYRRSRRKKEDKLLLSEVIDGLHPKPHLLQGKSVVNLLPEGAPHKGSAVLDLIRKSGSKHVFYIGDDKTDEDVFELNESRIMTVRVGYKNDSGAKYYIDRQSEINRVLKTILSFHKNRA